MAKAGTLIANSSPLRSSILPRCTTDLVTRKLRLSASLVKYSGSKICIKARREIKAIAINEIVTATKTYLPEE